MPRSVRGPRSISWKMLAVASGVAMLLTPSSPALADHKPKHQADPAGPPSVTVEGDSDDVAADPAEADQDDDSSESEGNSPKADRPEKEKDAGQDSDDSAIEEADAKPKLNKESQPKPPKPKEQKQKQAEAEPQGTGTGCGVDPCPRPKGGAQEAASPGVLSDVVSDAAGGSAVTVSQVGSPSRALGSTRTVFSRVPPTGDRERGISGDRLSLLRGAGILGAAQPSLAILVDALNDADADGVYSDVETAPESGADIDFKAIIANSGTTEFEITGVTHSFLEHDATVQVEVCADLDGLTLGPGESFGCSFSVADYSPPIGDTVVNTVTASAIEFGGSGTRGTSDSDTSTVATLLADQVLAAAVGRASGSLAFTGTDAVVLVALALLLLAIGGSARHLSRIRSAVPERPMARIGPGLRVPGVGSAANGRPLPKESARR
jgi:hypothetical protein